MREHPWIVGIIERGSNKNNHMESQGTGTIKTKPIPSTKRKRKPARTEVTHLKVLDRKSETLVSEIERSRLA